MRSLALLAVGFALGAATWAAMSEPAPDPDAQGPPGPALGGFFFKVEDPVAYKAWYATHLGIPFHESEGHFNACWRDAHTGAMARTVWGPFSDETTYFDPGRRDYMHNFRVADLDSLLARLEEEGVQILGGLEEYDYGRFAWILDLEGNRVELWEPAEKGYDWNAACRE